MTDTQKTVRVRIAVAVDHTGDWYAYGARDSADSMSSAIDGVLDGEARYWVEADLPIPTIPVVAGTVSEG